MLRIRPEQMDHFANLARERFANMMTDYIRDSFPESPPAKQPSELAGWVREALVICERYGVVMEPQAAQLILLLAPLGLDAVAREEWIHAALARDVAPVGKLRRLVDACRERELTEIEDFIVYDDLFLDPVLEA